jgi:hypothetical protein
MLKKLEEHHQPECGKAASDPNIVAIVVEIP